jgi:sulfur carrier protein
MPTITANGERFEVAEGATITDLLEQLGLRGRLVVVERNGEPVDRRRLGTIALAPGDRLELVRAVAGG